MARSKTIHDAPPPMYTKVKVEPSPFSKQRCNKCCLSANNWRKLRDWIDKNYDHPGLLDKLRGRMQVDQLLAFCQDRLWETVGNLLQRHYTMEIQPLPFRRQLDEDAIREAVKNLGWSIDSKGVIQRGGGDGTPAKA